MRIAQYIPLACAMLALCSCKDPRLLNSGASTAYWEVPQSVMDADHPRSLVMSETGSIGERTEAGVMMTRGDCTADGSRIRVVFMAPESVPQHEVCHLIDSFIARGDSPADALAHSAESLGPAVTSLPPLAEFFHACSAYLVVHPVPRARWQWQVLQNMHPQDAVIHHPEIIAELNGQESK